MLLNVFNGIFQVKDNSSFLDRDGSFEGKKMSTRGKIIIKKDL